MGVEMSEQGQDTGRVLVPVDQRRVALMEGDDVLAVRAEDGTIYLPLRPMCESLERHSSNRKSGQRRS